MQPERMNTMNPYQNQNTMQPQPGPPPQYHMPTQQNLQIPTVGNYIVVQLLALIPIAGFILMIIWAVGGGDTPIWKSNYARAYFVMIAISVGLSILLSILFFGIFAALISSLI